MTKFDRVANLDIRLFSKNNEFVGTVKIQNLRIAFQITKSLSWSTNTASVQVYNLSKDKRNKLKDYGDEISLFAGYSQDSGAQLLFIGDTTKVTHLFEQPEIITSLDAGDGERVLNNRLIDISFGSGTPARTVINGIAQKMGVNISFFAPTPNVVYQKGYQDAGMAKDILDRATKSLGLTWSVQNKNLIILEENGSTTKPPAIISQNTGMVGVPQRYTYKRRDLFRAGPKQGWKVKTLLRPDILPGDRVRVISNQVNLDEVLFVDSVKHTGDTWGSSWVSDWELIRI